MAKQKSITIHTHKRILVTNPVDPIIPVPPVTSGWNQLPIGAGGYITGVDSASDGTLVCKTDTYGGYLWNASTSRWDQLVTITSMPSPPFGGLDYEQGIYDIRICPNNTNRFYMNYLGCIYISNNRGTTWTVTGFTQVTHTSEGESCFPNDTSVTTYPKLQGPRIAIDPANADHLLVSTGLNGLFRSTNAGTSWTAIASVPVGSVGSHGVIVCFDPSSTVSGGITQGVYAASFGSGVYASTNGGVSFSASAGSPTTFNHMVCASDGKLFVAPDDGTMNSKRLSAGTWTSTSIGTASGRSLHTFAIDPSNSSRIVAVCWQGDLSVSLDSGVTWGGCTASPSTSVRVSPVIGWMAVTNESAMVTADAVFDPSQSNVMYIGEGIGVWKTNPNNTSTTAVTYTAQSVGIEQLVANQVVFPPSGTPIVAAWDRPLFKSPSFTTFPSSHGPDYAVPIQMGWDVCYAISDPTFLAAIVNWAQEKSCYSTNSGATWTTFTNFPSDTVGNHIGGSIAASTPNNLVYVQSNNGRLYYTLDGGATAWIAPTFAGVPSPPSVTGWSIAYYQTRKAVTADQVTANKFYAYNALTGVWMSSNGGVSWTLVYSGTINASFVTYINDRIKAVPGNAGHLFYASGRVGNQGDSNPDTDAFLKRSVDGGVTWTTVTDFAEVYDVSFGPVAPGQTYPSIFAAGWKSSVWGIWYSVDNCATWTNINGYPNGSFDWLTCMAADPNTLGRVVTGYRGSGWAYYGT